MCKKFFTTSFVVILLVIIDVDNCEFSAWQEKINGYKSTVVSVDSLYVFGDIRGNNETHSSCLVSIIEGPICFVVAIIEICKVFEHDVSSWLSEFGFL